MYKSTAKFKKLQSQIAREQANRKPIEKPKDEPEMKPKDEAQPKPKKEVEPIVEQEVKQEIVEVTKPKSFVGKKNKHDIMVQNVTVQSPILTQELWDKIIEVTEEEGFMSIICAEVNVPRNTIETWLNQFPQFRNAFLYARARLTKRYKREMLKASKQKKTEDWRVYKYLLGCLDEDFSELKWTRRNETQQGQTFVFVFDQKKVEEVEIEAQEIIEDIPGEEQQTILPLLKKGGTKK